MATRVGRSNGVAVSQDAQSANGNRSLVDERDGAHARL